MTDMVNKTYPSLILGLDISTACIGVSIIYDDGENEPKIEHISHVTPKIDKGIKGIEALILRKRIFEDKFLNKIQELLENIDCPLKTITECVIESPMVYASGGSNAETVAMLLQFNGLLSESIYDKLGIIPFYISSYEARMRSFPELFSVRKFNKKGEEYPISHVEKAIKDNKLVLFGSYPFDCDKKCIMMNVVSEKYPEIPWLYNNKGELKKENYDSCDALVCALAYANVKKHGDLDLKILDWNKIINVDGSTVITYKMCAWDKIYEKKLVFGR